MRQYILIERIRVQNANAIAGFTWGFPAITHFLGFIHNLSRKLENEECFQEIILKGCVVVSHEHKVHTYGSYIKRFTQSRNAPYQHGLETAKKSKAPSVIEEGKMNMTVSLIIGCEGNIGNRMDEFRQWLVKSCLVQRLAGGTILKLETEDISFYTPENKRDVRQIIRRLLPGFVLHDRSQYLETHFQNLINTNPDSELLDAWLDFSALKQKARPKSDLLVKHLLHHAKKEPSNPQYSQLLEVWHAHLDTPYSTVEIPDELRKYFDQLDRNETDSKLLKQWQEYCHPNEKTDADWEYLKKPEPGYLVPIMIGYKAISKVFENAEVSGTRDSETNVCFVEAVHSVGEWQSAHHLKTPDHLQECLWDYDYEDWYLCRQGLVQQSDVCMQSTDQDENSEESIFS